MNQTGGELTGFGWGLQTGRAGKSCLNSEWVAKRFPWVQNEMQKRYCFLVPSHSLLVWAGGMRSQAVNIPNSLQTYLALQNHTFTNGIAVSGPFRLDEGPGE